MNAQTCRLCMKTSIGDCNILGGDLKAVLDDILLKSIPSVYQLQNLICDECRCNLQVFANFKDTLDGTSQMDTYKSDVTLDLEDIENKNSIKPVDEVQNPTACNFCAKFIANRQFIPLNELKGNTYLINMLERHIPKLNLNNNEIILSCDSCLDSLQGLLSFITNCFDIQEKVRKYTEMEGDDTGPIDLEKLQKHTFRLTLPQESGTCNSVVEKEEQFDGYEDPVIKSELELKWENEDVLDPIIKREDIDIKSEKNGFDEYNGDTKQHKLTQNLYPSKKLNNSKDCTYETITQRCIEQHAVTHKGPSYITMYICKVCTFESKHRPTIKRHLLTHENPLRKKYKRLEITMHKCEVCPYETIRRQHMRQHILIHKDPSERKNYKCKYCSFETKSSSYLQRHTATHKGPMKVTMHKCEVCPYETKYSINMKRHVWTHKDPSDSEKYKCMHCSYETAIRGSLKRHLLIHKGRSERKMYKCKECPYTAITSISMKRHTLTHIDPSSIPMHRCVVCTYETKFRQSMRLHMLIHKDPSEREKYICICGYEAMNKSGLKWHMLTHKDSLQRKEYNCKDCSDGTKPKCEVCQYKDHSDNMKQQSERYKCNDCPYGTTSKTSLQRHILTHKSPSEREKYECTVCNKILYKTSMRHHLSTHDPANMTMHNCKVCGYKTIRNGNLNRHMLTHKNQSEEKK